MPDEPKPKTTRVANPELQQMAALDQVIAPMTDDARARVLMWLVTYYAPPGFSVEVEPRPSTSPSVN